MLMRCDLFIFINAKISHVLFKNFRYRGYFLLIKLKHCLNASLWRTICAVYFRSEHVTSKK
ncbi:hypothetical protein MOSE0_L10792 [Monosporozyma servazzii]